MLGMNAASLVRISDIFIGNELTYTIKLASGYHQEATIPPGFIPTYNTCHIIVLPISNPKNNLAEYINKDVEEE